MNHLYQSGADKYVGDKPFAGVEQFRHLGDTYTYTDYAGADKYKYLGDNTYTGGYTSVGNYDHVGDNTYTYRTDVDNYKYASGGDNFTYYTGPGGDRHMYGTGENFKYTADASLVPIHKSSKVTQVFENENTVTGAIKTSSTATHIVNGKKVTTNKMVENGKETVEVYEDGVLTRRSGANATPSASGYGSRINYSI